MVVWCKVGDVGREADEGQQGARLVMHAIRQSTILRHRQHHLYFSAAETCNTDIRNTTGNTTGNTTTGQIPPWMDYLSDSTCIQDSLYHPISCNLKKNIGQPISFSAYMLSCIMVTATTGHLNAQWHLSSLHWHEEYFQMLPSAAGCLVPYPTPHHIDILHCS